MPKLWLLKAIEILWKRVNSKTLVGLEGLTITATDNALDIDSYSVLSI
jgi:hypothetical protein